jgi:D-glycero-alpha-D-manno-heptose-7-phosphate kinase
VIKVPAGFQDYYPPLFRSVSCVHFSADGIEREALDINIEELEKRIAICYTGEPRLSESITGRFTSDTSTAIRVV